MNPPKHILLLQDLSASGIGEAVNIAPFLKRNFRQINADINTLNEQTIPIRHFVNDLKRREFISPMQEDAIIIPYYDVSQQDIVTYDSMTIEFYITSTGLDYLEQYEQSQIDKRLTSSYIDVNNASKINYKNQTALGIVTLGLALLTAFIAGLTYSKSDTTAASIDSLRLEITKWRTQNVIPISNNIRQPHPHRP